MKAIRYSYFFILFFQVINFGFAQQELPPVYNFNIKEFKVRNQSWGIAEYNNYVYVANNDRLLEFDGITWRVFQLPKKTIVRTVSIQDGRIYTGSFEEFGYWERSGTGELVYKSLVNTLDNDEIKGESIRGVYFGKDEVIFKSYTKIYIYKNGKTTPLNAKTFFHASTFIGDTFYAAFAEKGIYKLNNLSFELVPGSDKLKDYRVQAITPYGENQFMITTLLNGCFILSGNNIKAWGNPLNELLKGLQITAVNNINKDKLFFGTIESGLYVLDKNDNSYYNLNTNNGLQNNTISALTVTDNMVWLALDNGVSVIPVNNYSAYYLNPSKQNIGGVYDAVRLNDKSYLATNSGIFIVNDKGVEFAKESHGQTWDLHVVEDEIICGHNSGTFSLKEDTLTQISEHKGGYTFVPVPESNLFIQGNYSGVSIYSKELGGWKENRITEIDFPVESLIFESPHVVWVAHPYKGVCRVQLSANYESAVKIETFDDDGLLDPYDIMLFKVENDIAFYSKNKWFVYNSIEKKIVPFSSLNTILGSYKLAFPISETFVKPFIFKDKSGNIFLRNEIQDSLNQVFLPKKYYEGLLIDKNEKAVVINDSLTYILLYNNVLAFNQQKINFEKKTYSPRVERIMVNGEMQSLAREISLNRKDTLEIEMSAPFLSNSSIAYRLSGKDKNWKLLTGKLLLHNLPYGDHELSFKTFNTSFETSQQFTTLRVNIKYPWYMGVYGILCFLILITLIFFINTTINKYVLIKHKRYLDELYTHQQELLLKEEALNHERKLNEFQKEQHVKELNAKTKELANNAMAMTKKNELLLNLKNNLLQFKNEILSKSEFNKLLKSIDKNINNDKDWEIFESNFNQIHESFFKTLLDKHPDILTPKDLKLCAYLKLNLSTKEISPLMSISCRGVEIHRYRLRKKLNLEKNQSLNEYLMNIY